MSPGGRASGAPIEKQDDILLIIARCQEELTYSYMGEIGVGLVHVRRDGRRMFYRANAEEIRPVHEWTGKFERLWKHQLHRVKERAEGKMRRPEPDPNSRRRITTAHDCNTN